MRTIISISEMNGIPGQYECMQQHGARPGQRSSAGRSPGAAASYALFVALGRAGPYVIVGPENVMAHIPADIRSRGEL